MRSLFLVIGCMFIQSSLLCAQNAEVATEIKETVPSSEQDQDQQFIQNTITALGPNGELVVIYEKGDMVIKRVSESLEKKLLEYKTNNVYIYDVEFTPSGGFVVLTENDYYAENVGGRFEQSAQFIEKNGDRVTDVTFFPMHWTEKRAYTLTTENGLVIQDGIEELLTKVEGEFEPTIVTNKSPKKKQLAEYRFSFDWLSVYAASDGGSGNADLQLFGFGLVQLFVNNKLTGENEQISDRIVRVFTNGQKAENGNLTITRDNPLIVPDKSGTSLYNADYYIPLDPAEFGYNSIEELEENAYLQIGFRLRERDISTLDDDFPFYPITIPLKERNLQKLQLEQVLEAEEGTYPNVLRLAEGDSMVGIAFSFNKLQPK